MTVTPVNSTTVTVSWSDVQCFNVSGVVTHYLVQYWSMCSGAVQNVTTNSLVQNVTGLTLNVAVYTFRVAAVGSGQKMGPLSNPVNASLRGMSRRLISYSDLLRKKWSDKLSFELACAFANREQFATHPLQKCYNTKVEIPKFYCCN